MLYHERKIKMRREIQKQKEMLVIEVILIECSKIEHLGSGNNLDKKVFGKAKTV